MKLKRIVGTKNSATKCKLFMNLRSGRSVMYLKASTQESGTRIGTPLKPIDKQTYSKSSTSRSTTASEASLAMGDSTKEADYAKAQFK